MALAATLFATMNFLARLASGHAHWTLVACVRATIGAAIGFAVARARGKAAFVPTTRLMWQRSVLGTIAMGCTFYALGRRELPLGDTATLLNLTPIVLALVAPLFLKEQSSRQVWVAILVAAAGVVLIVRPTFLFGGTHALGDAAIVPAVVAVVASVFSAFAMMSLRRVSAGLNAEAIVVHFSLTGAVALGLVALAARAPLPSVTDALPLLGAGVCAGFAQLAMTRAYAMQHATRVSGVGYLAVPISALLGAAWLHEWPAKLALLGMALVVAGGLLITRRE
jgi:drug/metabolite transporter (DMT)-like permease